ncbi:MAG: carboxylating nicotinate-nucleotide diphosphorylase [Planctomycetota bacterium]
MNDYVKVEADEQLERDLRLLVRLAIAEDLRDAVDWTSICVVGDTSSGACQVTPRCDGVAAGLDLLPWVLDEFDADIRCEVLVNDGAAMASGVPVARLTGNARDILTAERVMLNLLCRLCGVATQTKAFVQAISGTNASVYDTRKTTPGMRLLEKYAVACGGGKNHRRGLYDGFLIKDNHLQLGSRDSDPLPPSEAVNEALRWRGGQFERLTAPQIVEVEVDSLQQLRDVLSANPDIVLIDNFDLDEIKAAVSLRNELNSGVELEVSGNVKLDTIGAIAATGVERISSGALIHQATWLDLGLDWYDATAT